MLFAFSNLLYFDRMFIIINTNISYLYVKLIKKLFIFVSNHIYLPQHIFQDTVSLINNLNGPILVNVALKINFGNYLKSAFFIGSIKLKEVLSQ